MQQKQVVSSKFLLFEGRKSRGRRALYSITANIFLRTSSSSTAIFSVGHRQGKNRCHFWTSLAGHNL